MYDELVTFIRIVKSGSFAEASKSLGISTPTLTRNIQKLEKELNLVVIKRNTHYFELSKSGKLLYDKFCNLENDLKHTIAEIETENNKFSGRLDILMPPFFAIKVITPYLKDFTLKYPNIQLNLSYQNRQINLIKESFDLAIINQRPKQKNQKMRILCRSKVIFYCYPDYLKQLKLPITQKQIEATLKLGIMLDHGTATGPIYLINKRTGQKTLFNPTYSIMQDCNAHDQEVAKSWPTIGVGIDIMLRNDIASGAIIQLLPDYYILGYEYYLLINPEGKNARTKVFIDFIDECMQKLNLNKNLMLD